jgi:DNA ligase 1
VLLDEIARTSTIVSGLPARLAKIKQLAACLNRLRPGEVGVAVAYLSGELPQGPMGVGWASMRGLPPPAPGPPTLELLDVDATLRRIAAISGAGSQAARRHELTELFGGATQQEQHFLIKLLLGELRQGALEGMMVEAVAAAAGASASEIRRALMLAGDLGVVAIAAIADGPHGLSRFGLAVFRPLKPMLAQSAENLHSAFARINSPCAVEWKVDGARIQIHRLGSEVRAFSRNLADVTDRVPEAVEVVRDLPVKAAVFDGEAIALRPDGGPHPFQVTMSRFGSRLEVNHLRHTVPLSLLLFDCLHLDGDDLVDRPAAERFAALFARVPEPLIVPRIMTNDPAEAEPFRSAALQRGHEGVMALRFARVKGYRPDKRPEEADTIDTVRAIHAGGTPERG